jgi:limonene-1,2-epoxide hydrolase
VLLRQSRSVGHELDALHERAEVGEVLVERTDVVAVAGEQVALRR